ncbi:PDC sensor domain-containing protein [Myxococcaceae bacterium JPH2]|nr:PDC sensor domain-containing protein [Myxococcaceae bacterium JPH2]
MVWLSLAVAVLAQMPPEGVAQVKKVDALVPELRKLAADPEVVKAVRAQNARHVPRATVLQRDGEWTAATALTPFQQALLDNTCSRALRRLRQPWGLKVAESFAMDDQGALVGATGRTSDYWQGDEPAWQRAYAGGRGGEHRSEVVFDESTQAFVVQVSLPIRDGAQVIGAVTFGISLLDL